MRTLRTAAGQLPDGGRLRRKNLQRAYDCFVHQPTGGFVHGWTQDFRYAIRMLRSHPGFFLIAALALALGTGANTAVFTVVNGVLLRPLPFPRPDRLILIADARRGADPASARRLADRDYLALRRTDRALEALATFDAHGVDLAGAGEPVHIAAAAVTADFFRALGVAPILGRAFTADDEGSPVVAIGASLWRGRFGAAPNVVGSMVKIDGVPHTVIAVMTSGFAYPDGAELWTPLAIHADPRVGYLRATVGRLRPGASARDVAAELQAALRPGRVAVVQPFQELMVGDARRVLLVFDGAVGFVLLIACANVANLLLIGAASRRQEMSIRGAVGASAGRLARQLLTESAVLTAVGGAGGLLLAAWGVPLLLALAPEGAIPRAAEVRIDGWVMAFTVAVSALTGVVFGLAPLPGALRRELRPGPYRVRLRNGLAVVELALALVLLAGGGLMLKSSLRMRAVDSGFRPENVLALDLSLPDAVYRTPAARLAFEDRLLAKLAAVAGVDAVGAIDIPPLSGIQMRGVIRAENGAPLPGDYVAQQSSASPGYFRAMGIRLRRGRDFDARDDASAAPVAIVSESVARDAWPGQDPLGKRIGLHARPGPEDWLTVVGVVQDVRQFGPAEPMQPEVYRPLAQSPTPVFGRDITFVAHTAIDASLIAPTILRHAVGDIERSQAIASLATMQDRVTLRIAEPVFQTRVLAAFAVMALLLAAVGIYGVGAFAVAERTREIGIRMALGAGRPEILRQMLGSALALAGAGVALGTAGAFAATRALTSLLFEVKPGDPAVFAGVAALLAVVAMFAGWIPARRATRVDPVEALRYE